MNLDDVVFVAETSDAIIMAFLQVAMLVSVFLCGWFFGARDGYKVDDGECVHDEGEVIDDGSAFD